MIVGEQAPAKGDVRVPKKLHIGYFRQDVEEMQGGSVLDEAIAGSGRLGDVHHDLESAASCDGRSRAGGPHRPHSSALRRGAGGNTNTSAATRWRRKLARLCTGRASKAELLAVAKACQDASGFHFEASYFAVIISTRRFKARPASVALSATGRVGPKPCGASRPAATP